MSRKDCSAIVMNTSIGSDGERSECGSPDSSGSPPQTPASINDKRFEHDSIMVAASRKLIAQNLKFSIENILRPDFGHPSSKIQYGNGMNSRSASTAPNSPSFSPSGTTGSQSTNPNMLWPAWVYCTRYSDRPSSGKIWYHNLHCNCVIFISIFLYDSDSYTP